MDSSFLLSLELIYLMSWLVKNEKSRLKILIKEAIEDGLGKELDTIAQTSNTQTNEILHETFVNFLVYLEKELMDSLEKSDKKKPLREQLIASIKDLNLQAIDTQTLWLSIKQAEKELSSKKNNDKNLTTDETKQLVLEKMVKNWKPTKKEMVN